MTARLYRTLVLFCCTAAAGFVAAGAYRYFSEYSWAQQINTPETIAAIGAVPFRAPEFTSNTFYIAGLFLALGGCLWLKADQVREPAGVGTPRAEDEPSIGDEG